jgi:hypothetical protein
MRIPQTVRALNDDCYDELFDDEGQMARRLDGEHYCEKERSQTSELDPRTARCLACLPLGDPTLTRARIRPIVRRTPQMNYYST